MKKLLTFVFVCSLATSVSSLNFKSDNCEGCEYDLEFVKTINGGDDSEYKLKCSKTGNKYSVYKRKNGKWERLGSSKEYDKCDLVKYMCDCD